MIGGGKIACQEVGEVCNLVVQVAGEQAVDSSAALQVAEEPSWVALPVVAVS